MSWCGAGREGVAALGDHAGGGDGGGDLLPGQVAADARLGPLAHLDLHRGGALQVAAVHAEAARGHLDDRVGAVGVEVLVQAALAAVPERAAGARRLRQDAVHVEVHRSERHGAEHASASPGAAAAAWRAAATAARRRRWPPSRASGLRPRKVDTSIGSRSGSMEGLVTWLASSTQPVPDGRVSRGRCRRRSAACRPSPPGAAGRCAGAAASRGCRGRRRRSRRRGWRPAGRGHAAAAGDAALVRARPGRLSTISMAWKEHSRAQRPQPVQLPPTAMR